MAETSSIPAWVITAVYAKQCGAPDPAAVVEQVAREFADTQSEYVFDWGPTLIRRIEELSTAAGTSSPPAGS